MGKIGGNGRTGYTVWDQIEAKLDLQRQYFSWSSSHGDANSTLIQSFQSNSISSMAESRREIAQRIAASNREIRALCISIIAKLQEEINASDSMIDALPTPGEILPATESIEEHSLTKQSEEHSANTESFLVIHRTPTKREVQIAQIGLEVTTSTTPSPYPMIATMPLLEPHDARSFSELRRTTVPPWPEMRWKGSMKTCLSHARKHIPTQSPPLKPPDWTHSRVANPPPPPKPPDLTCCVVANVFVADKYFHHSEYGEVADTSRKIKWEAHGTMQSVYEENGCRYLDAIDRGIELDSGYLPAVYGIIKKAGCLLIAAEVQSEIGPTVSHFWGFEAHEIIQDSVTLEKGVGKGAPINWSNGNNSRDCKGLEIWVRF